MDSQDLSVIETATLRYLTGHSPRGAAFNAEMARYHFSTGGKRLRAMIPGRIFEACGERAERALPIGCALEMVHNATLVHDDLQDGDEIRRGQATVWKRWSPAQAINCGDAMFYFAIDLLDGLEAEAPLRLRVINRLVRGTLEVIEGQAQEFRMKDEPLPDLDRYMGVIRGKTAALFATAIGAPLIALGKPDATVTLAEQAALDLGILFQLQDDLLDLYGDKGRERRGTDVAEGKVSALVAELNARGPSREREQVREILRKPREATTDRDISEVVAIFDRSGAKGAVVSRVKALRAGLRAHPLASVEPGVHRLILELADLFLKPVAEMFTEVQARS